MEGRQWGGRGRKEKKEQNVSRAHLKGMCCYLENGSIKLPGFPGGSAGKEPADNAGDPGSIPGLGRSPGEGYGHPPHYSCLENPHGQRSLEGYSPWDHRVRHE